MIRVFVLVVLVILHLCLYPWQFSAETPESRPLSVLLNSWHLRYARRQFLDIAANVALYIPLGIAAYLSLCGKFSRAAATAATLLTGAALSAVVEMAQLYLVLRVTSAVDFVANLAGTAAGIMIGWFLEPALATRAPVAKASGSVANRGPKLLLALWVGYQMYPLIVETFWFPVLAKVRALLAASFSVPLFFSSVADWLAVLALVRFATRKHSWLLSVCLLLLPPFRLFIRTRSVTWPELAAIPAALLISAALARTGRQYLPAILGAVLAMAILLNGMTPFRFTPGSHSFGWMPFEGVIQSGENGKIMLLWKSFRYGTLLWLVRRCGVGYRNAAVATALLLAGIEWVQLRLPNHVPEVTDPLLAMMMAFVLSRFDRPRVEMWPGSATTSVRP